MFTGSTIDFKRMWYDFLHNTASMQKTTVIDFRVCRVHERQMHRGRRKSEWSRLRWCTAMVSLYFTEFSYHFFVCLFFCISYQVDLCCCCWCCATTKRWESARSLPKMWPHPHHFISVHWPAYGALVRRCRCHESEFRSHLHSRCHDVVTKFCTVVPNQFHLVLLSLRGRRVTLLFCVHFVIGPASGSSALTLNILLTLVFAFFRMLQTLQQGSASARQSAFSGVLFNV